MNESQIIAALDESQPARVWYLPLAGKEHIEYPDRATAASAAVRLCVIAGVPVVTPLSRPKES